jgi:FkbM family methyltransferase
MFFIKSKLRPLVRGPLKNIANLLRSIEASPLSHTEIAALIQRPKPTILEIGCNDGCDTIEFLRVMPDATIYCFEPDHRAIKRFKDKVGNRHNVSLFEGAVSNRSGTIDFHVSDIQGGFDQSGSIRRPKNHIKECSWVSFDSTINIPSVRLDDWSKDNHIQHVDFIWMDVQGAEGDVIAGAQETLERTRFIFTEYSNNELYEGQPSLRKLIASIPSFEVVKRYPGDVLLRNKHLS